ncbi:cyclin-L1 isoform X2 [Bacillus rossius redtenbacheri]|uniref:cyclin-L1 isoform X2 n=1 Tax=Bacillus rossius redtenbacheri TaxID=93214 RepID=UPI002FDCA98A
MSTSVVSSESSRNAKSSSKPYGKVVLTLKNSLLPDEKLSGTPSQDDGLDFETETDLRILGCELIQTAGILLRLPQVSMATGQVLFQRFYYSKSFVRHDMETTAMACVCLASKIEEAPRSIRDVMNVFNHVKQVKNQKTISPMILDQNYVTKKTQVIKAERRVLKELGFCVHLMHPHKLIVMYLRVLGYLNNISFVQNAWNYMNDSFRTNVFVRYQPETIACACIYLTARKLDIPLPKNPPWFGVFGVLEDDIKEICFQVLRLYKRQKPSAEDLDRRVKELRVLYQEERQKVRSQASTAQRKATDADANAHSRNGSASPSGSKNGPRSINSSPRLGFYSRKEHYSSKHRSRSRSTSLSRSPYRKHSRKTKKNRMRTPSRSKSRSRSPYDRKSRKTKARRSPSHSPTPSRKSHKSERSITETRGHAAEKATTEQNTRVHVRSISTSMTN